MLRATAHSIFRSIKIWFPLQMKTIGLYIVAGASGTHADAESQTQTPIPGCVGEWRAAAGRADEQAGIDSENGDRQSDRKFF